MNVPSTRPFGDALESVLPAYEIPVDDLVGEVLVPGLREAEEVRIAAGFFSSRCLAQIAPGLSAFIASGYGKIRVLISPEIGPEDREAIGKGLRDPGEALNDFVIQLLVEADHGSADLPRHCQQCLSFLVASNRLDLRFVLMDSGMYHKKQWLLRDGGAWLAVHGSGNATLRGLLLNGEQMTIDRTWRDGPAAETRVSRFLEQFERQWQGLVPHSLTVQAEPTLAFLADRHTQGLTEPPSVADFWRAWMADHEAGLEPPLPPNALPPASHQRLAVPSDLSWREGRFEHQGRAVDAFLKEGRGIFSIATGGGKTKAALIAASAIQDREDSSLLLVILAPSRPLVRQWADEIRLFGVPPVVLSGQNRRSRVAVLDGVEAALRGDTGHSEALVATGSLFGSDETFREWLDRMSRFVPTVLIADEVHNFGTPTFLDHQPEDIQYRLGLSATPMRQYDPEGTARLAQYFGDSLIEFSLGDAIRTGCLVPYDYHVHEVQLSGEEFDLYLELTQRLGRLGFLVDDDGATPGLNPRIESLLRQRRAVLEQAEGKLSILDNLLQRAGTRSVRRTLIYASAKPPVLDRPRQIDRVNELLAELGVISHQLTSRETSDSSANAILDAFGRGEYQVLTAMKVLDEGVDVPQTETAVLLASSTVRREWIQRRGRVLRTWNGKEAASLHDFLVVPPSIEDEVSRRLVRSELERITEFGRFSRNEFDPDGSVEVERRLERLLTGR